MKILILKAMGNSQQSSPYPRMKYSNNSQSSVPPQNVEDFERRWKAFIQSLDVTPQNIQNIDQLEESQKIELLMNFESKNPKCSAFHYVTLIKGLRSFKISNSKKKDEFQNAKQILSATEISLRTNNVEWVYDFLKHNGLEILVDYMSQTLLHLIRFEEIQISPLVLNQAICGAVSGGGSSSGAGLGYSVSGAITNPDGSIADGVTSANQSLRRIFDTANLRHSTRGPSSGGGGGGVGGASGSCRSTRSAVLSRTTSSAHKAQLAVVDSIKECIHLCLKCFRTLLNNQKGCRLAFEHRDTINVITLCLLHPSYQTKSLVLDLLSAVCLIEGGHERVLKAFDIFKAMTGEEHRFETLMYYYRHHEALPLDDYNIDYAVSNMQFVNIIVHSVDNINLRVYLQFEFTLLGLDDFLKRLQDRPGDRLNRQVDAYLDNTVECSVLLEDAEAKEAYVSECERLEKDVSSLQEALSSAEAEKARKIKDAEDRVRRAEKELDKAKAREEDLSLLVESLRSKIRDINVDLSDRESDMQKQIVELQQQLMTVVPVVHAPAAAAAPTVAGMDNPSPTTAAAGHQKETRRKKPSNGDSAAHATVSSGLSSTTENHNGVREAMAEDETKPVAVGKKTSVDVSHTPIKSSLGATATSSGGKHQTRAATGHRKETDVAASAHGRHSNHEETTAATDMLDCVLNEASADKRETNPGSVSQMETSVMSCSGGNGAAPLIKWNILRSQQGTVFEQIDGSKIEQQLDLACFEKIFKVPPSLNSVENEYDIPPAADTIDSGSRGRQRHQAVASSPSRQLANQQTFSATTSVVMVTSGSNKNNNDVTPDDRISLLDQNRKKCLQVVVQYLKQEQLLLGCGVTFREWGGPLARYITAFELGPEAADRLLYQLPSYQETDMFRDIAADQLDILSDEDRLVALLSCIDRIEMKLEATLYMHAFDETYFGLQEKIRIVALACKSVMDSEKLKKILEIVLAFGNRMNDSRRGKALGFRIQSLDMLPECRSPDDKWSLMNYIVYCIEEKFPDLLSFVAELESVEDASRVSLCNLLAAIEELSTGLDRVAEELASIGEAVQSNPDLIPMRLVLFVKDNTGRVGQLRTQAGQARIAFVKTVEWFGEKDLQTASPDLFFGTLTRFMDSFKKAMAENSRRKIGGASGGIINNRRRHKERKSDESKGDQSRKKNRTRQINADGIMDDILAGLDYQPLQAGIHGRGRAKKEGGCGGDTESNITLMDN